ncbi:arginase [Polycladidibacter stylochi]|uniref:arginase n=1 Tax=Polycladidibacter stylochi TaxID=1807766 RepID=UPI0008363C33|nr:arginase [Pseudovibrio stylochi]
MNKKVVLIGAPIETGTHISGCRMGPDAFRCAKLVETLQSLGLEVEDWGNQAPKPIATQTHANGAIHHLAETIGWTQTLFEVAVKAMHSGALPVFIGGDHSMAMGTVSGISESAAQAGQEQFVLWLDAHPDYHGLSTTMSGNLHGTPAAYFTGRSGFTPYFQEVANPIKPENICMLGLRSVDQAERDALMHDGVLAYDMRYIDEHGISQPLQSFLQKVKQANGRLHLSFDVDFLEPDIAPAVGTTVPGGATFREAHLIMEILADSNLVTSVDLVELNPFLDERGKTASLMVDFIASLFGRRVLDRVTTASHGPMMGYAMVS